ncbi:MAG: hypothetical protein FWF08_08110 [Oscillospiraceae bacterium]|nr:hypothetical protein [Oscillospiraceae bacterium]
MSESRARYIALIITGAQMVLLSPAIRFFFIGNDFYYPLHLKAADPSFELFRDVVILLAIGVFIILAVYYRLLFYILTVLTFPVSVYMFAKTVEFLSYEDFIAAPVFMMVALVTLAPHMFYYIMKIRVKRQNEIVSKE